MTTDTRTRAFLLAPAALASALFLASCGGAAEETSESAVSQQDEAGFNDADVAFAQMMIPHHEQAVEMSQLARSRSGDGVRELAAGIEAAQGPEIELLGGMLADWDAGPAGGADHDGMAGMMTEERMVELGQVEGDAFDTMFLEMMIDHHEGAVEMARDQLENGAAPEALELAQEIIDAQEAEIEQMDGMLGDGSGSEDDGE